jgi:hypothetical protein
MKISMVRRTSPRLLPALLLGLALLSCAAPAPGEFQSFATAAREVRAGGQLVYDRVAPFIAPEPAGRAPGCAYAELGVPCTFAPSPTEAGGGPPELVVRRSLLDLATAYAVLLAEAAEGASPARLQAKSQEMIALASATLGAVALVTPAAPFAPVISALPALIERFEQARAAVALRNAILADRPTIQAVLRALERDTGDLYTIYAAGRYEEFNRGQLQVTTREAILVRRQAARQDIEQFSAALSAYARALRAMSAALDQLGAATDGLGRPTPANLTRDIEGLVAFAVDARRLVEVTRGAIAAPR